MSFKALLQRWQSRSPSVKADPAFSVRLPMDDAARVLALAEMYGMDPEAVITDLLHAALAELAEAMPYESGSRVIREDEYGDPVYEDRGPTPRFIELTRVKRDELVALKKRD